MSSWCKFIRPWLKQANWERLWKIPKSRATVGKWGESFMCIECKRKGFRSNFSQKYIFLSFSFSSFFPLSFSFLICLWFFYPFRRYFMDSLPYGPSSRGHNCKWMILTCKELGVKSGVCAPVSVWVTHMFVGQSMQGREVGKGGKKVFMALTFNFKVYHFLLLPVIFEVSGRNTYAVCLLWLK